MWRGKREGLITAPVHHLFFFHPETKLWTNTAYWAQEDQASAPIYSLRQLPHISVAKPAKLWAFSSYHYHGLGCQNLFSIRF